MFWSFCKKFICFLRQLTVLVLLFYSYFVFVYIFCIKSLEMNATQYSKWNINLTFCYLFGFNINFLLVIWFYLLITFKRHKKPQDRYFLDKNILKKFNLDNYNEDENDDSETFETKLTISQNSQLEMFVKSRNICLKTRNNYGHIRICLKCRIVKPDRCSHCKSCQKCILKRDHHCPWLNKCIGFSNQKYYICMLSYLTSLIVLVLTSLFWTFCDIIKLIRNYLSKDLSFFLDSSLEKRTNMIQIFSLYLFCCLIFLPIVLLLINTYCLAFSNLTNIEHNFPPFITDEKTNNSRATIWENFKEIFGYSYLLAYLPVFTTPGDGHNFSFNFNQIEKVKCFC